MNNEAMYSLSVCEAEHKRGREQVFQNEKNYAIL